MKREIQVDEWDRREHFNFFLQSNLPFYNVNFNVDVSGLREVCKDRSVSVNNTIMHVTVRSMKNSGY